MTMSRHLQRQLQGYEQVITNVMDYLDCHRVDAVEALFPEHNDEYRNQWLKRSAREFWLYLDRDMRQRVIKLAWAEYHGGEF